MNPLDNQNYQLLARLQQDCEYYLGAGGRHKKHLWALDEALQIQKMKELYESLPAKPDWLTLDAINGYEEKMMQPKENNRKEGVVKSPENVVDIKNADGTEYQDDSEKVLFRSPESDVYVAQMPNGHIAITDGFSTDYVNIRSKGSWVRESDQFAIGKDIKDFLSSMNQSQTVDAINPQTEPSGYVVLTIVSTDNAAFVDIGRDYEIAKIVNDAASTIEQATTLRDVAFKLRDTNGNTVGKAQYTELAPSGDLEDGSVRLSVQAGNAAFSEDGPSEVARILREAAAKARDGEHIFALRDYNGNTVGKFEFREQPSLVKDGVIDMTEALNSGRVYKADDSYMGIADGEHRYVVTTPDFTPGYKQGDGDVWLVNAKGEIASGYEEPQRVREVTINELTTGEKSDLRAVAEGRVSFEDFERRIVGDEPELG